MLSADECQIKQLIEKWIVAVQNKNIDQILAFYDSDSSIFDVPFSNPSFGINEIKRTWELYLIKAKKGRFKIFEVNMMASEGIGACYGLINCSGGNLMDITLRFTACLIKKQNEWKIWHEHHSLIPECAN